MKYPVYQPYLSGNEKKYVNDCLDSSWISSKGEYVDKFEKSFAKYCSVKGAVSVSNGTVALHVALLALGIGPGDEILVPTLSYIASANAIVYTGATPVFVDCDIDTWQMCPTDTAKKITDNTKAILCVHLYGHPCDMDRLLTIAQENNIYLIEDCAEALGSKYKSKIVGKLGDIATFSFYGNKTITTGEGGMVISNNKSLIDKARKIKSQGLIKGTFYDHDIIGYNYRMTNICAAIGLAQLENIDIIIKKKLKIAEYYKEFLLATPCTLQTQEPDTLNTYWLCTILVPKADMRNKLMEHLRNNSIDTRPVFSLIHEMPMYIQESEVEKDGFSNSRKISNLGLSLPSYPQLQRKDVSFICEKIKQFFE